MLSHCTKHTSIMSFILLTLVMVSSLSAGEPRLIGTSRIDELPPLPLGTQANTLVQPAGIPVPIFEVISDEKAGRGAIASTGPATAVVYRNSHDTGLARHNKADAGKILADAVTDFMQRLNIPNGLSAVGYTTDDIPALVEGTLPQHRVTKLSPRPVGAEELAALFEDAMVGW